MRRKDEILKQLQKPKLFCVEDLLSSNVERPWIQDHDLEGGKIEIVAFLSTHRPCMLQALFPLRIREGSHRGRIEGFKFQTQSSIVVFKLFFFLKLQIHVFVFFKLRDFIASYRCMGRVNRIIRKW